VRNFGNQGVDGEKRVEGKRVKHDGMREARDEMKTGTRSGGRCAGFQHGIDAADIFRGNKRPYGVFNNCMDLGLYPVGL
jgi:hypothetical protein